MNTTDDYHKMQKCEYYQSEECDCLTECSFQAKEKQKALLIEIMKEDEKYGMYEESQEELWGRVISDARCYDGTPQEFRLLTQHFQRNYTITRNPQVK